MALVPAYRALSETNDAITRIAKVNGHVSAAAYEMEINTNGLGLGVLKYLQTGDQQFRERVEKDAVHRLGLTDEGIALGRRRLIGSRALRLEVAAAEDEVAREAHADPLQPRRPPLHPFSGPIAEPGRQRRRRSGDGERKVESERWNGRGQGPSAIRLPSFACLPYNQRSAAARNRSGIKELTP